MFEPGYEIDRYVVETLLGEGGAASVWRVRHKSLGTAHAMKVIAVPTARARRRALREARSQAVLDHVNIVAAQDVFEDGGVLTVLMELVRGPSIRVWLENYRPSVDEALAVFSGVLTGVAHAHAQGLIHRDLKPGNVLLQPTEHGLVPKVADFGLVKVLDGDVTDTRTGMMLGTPAYQSPEQCRDPKSVNHVADVFSLGCTLYELLAGRRPFQGNTPGALFEQMERGEFEPIVATAPHVPEGLGEVLAGMLEPDPASRISDVLEVQRLLEAHREPLHGEADLPAHLRGKALPVDSPGYAAALSLVKDEHAGAKSVGSSGATYALGDGSALSQTRAEPVEPTVPLWWPAGLVTAGVLAAFVAIGVSDRPPAERVTPEAAVVAPTVQPAVEPEVAEVAVPELQVANEPAPERRPEATETVAVAPTTEIEPTPQEPEDAVVEAEVVALPQVVEPAGVWLAGAPGSRLDALRGQLSKKVALVDEAPELPEVLVTLGGTALQDSLTRWPDSPIVALDAPQRLLGSPNVTAVPSGPDPRTLVDRLVTAFPGLSTLAGIHRGEDRWWSAVGRACEARGVAWLSRDTDPLNVDRSANFVFARAQVVLIRPDSGLWTADNLNRLFGAAQSNRAGVFPVVSWNEAHLSLPTPATFAAVAKPGSEAVRAGELVQAQLNGQPMSPGWLPLELVGRSKPALAEAAGVHLGRALEGVDRLAQ